MSVKSPKFERGNTLKQLLKIGFMVVFIVFGFIGLLGALEILSKPTTADLEKVRKADHRRLAEQPAVSNRNSLAQLYDDK